ncbi:MAG: dimethylsulfonioproprionate lyase family protein [Brevirhabdus sp.]
MQHALSHLLRALAGLFAAEGRPGGLEAAAALGLCASGPHRFTHHPIDDDLLEEARQALSTTPLPEAGAVVQALDLINWHFSGLEDGRINPDIARHMLTAELIGPDGMVYHPSVRAGLFMQAAGIDYVTRRHMAEETFVMLGGEGVWFVGDGPGQLARAGDILHHPSDAPHRSVTEDMPLIAAWRWTGGIAYEDYRMTG